MELMSIEITLIKTKFLHNDALEMILWSLASDWEVWYSNLELVMIYNLYFIENDRRQPHVFQPSRGEDEGTENHATR